MKKFFLLLVAFLPAISIAACGQARTTAPPDTAPAQAFKNMTVQELKPLLEKKDFFLVDVHIPEQPHLGKTDLFVPYDEIDKNIAKFPTDKKTKIIVYCRSGNMSQSAAQRLVQLGYTDVTNLEGGMYAWKAAGYSVE